MEKLNQNNTKKMAMRKCEDSRDINSMIAREIMGWKEIQAPQWDYDGPLPEQGMVLVPPGFDENGHHWPNRGVVPYHYFVTNDYSTDMSEAMKVVSIMAGRGYEFSLTLEKRKVGGCVYVAKSYTSSNTKTGTSPTPAKAICLAAVGLIAIVAAARGVKNKNQMELNHERK